MTSDLFKEMVAALKARGFRGGFFSMFTGRGWEGFKEAMAVQVDDDASPTGPRLMDLGPRPARPRGPRGINVYLSEAEPRGHGGFGGMRRVTNSSQVARVASWAAGRKR